MADTGWKSPTTNGSPSNEFTNPANAYASDNTYATRTYYSQTRFYSTHSYKGFGISIPAGSVINGIEVTVEGYCDGTAADAFRISLYLNGGATSDQKSQSFGHSDNQKTYGSSSDLWGASASSYNWSDSVFGLQVVAYNDSSTATNYLDHVQVKVYYTESPSVSVYDDVTVSEDISLRIPTLFISLFESITINESLDNIIPNLFIESFDSIVVNEDISTVIPVIFIDIYDSVAVSENINLLIIRTLVVYPDPTPKLYEEYTTDNDAATFYDDRERGQSFTMDDSKVIRAIKVKLSKNGSPTGNLTLTLKATSDGLPTGSALATATIDAATLTGSAAIYTFTLGTPYSASSGLYCFYLTPDGAGTDSGNCPKYHYDNAAGYTGGTSIYTESGTWYTDAARDWYFQIYVTGDTVDGVVLRSTTGENIATISAGAGNNHEDNGTTINVVYLQGNATPLFVELIRSIFLFDTSALPDGATILSATLNLYVSASVDDLTGQTFNIVSSNPASNAALVNADYGQLGTTKFSSDVNVGGQTTSAYLSIPLNASGLAAISGTGITKLGCRLTCDGLGGSVTPSNNGSYLQVNSADFGSNKPYLEIVYTLPLDVSNFESVIISEDISLSIPNLFINVDESITVSDDNTSIMVITREIHLDELFIVSENVSLLIPVILVEVNDSVTVSEEVSMTGDEYSIDFETVNISEYIILNIPLPVNMYDSVTVSEFIQTTGIMPLFVHDSIIVLENTAIEFSTVGRLFPNVPRGKIYSSQGLTYGGTISIEQQQGSLYPSQGFSGGGSIHGFH